MPNKIGPEVFKFLDGEAEKMGLVLEKDEHGYFIQKHKNGSNVTWSGEPVRVSVEGK